MRTETRSFYFGMLLGALLLLSQSALANKQGPEDRGATESPPRERPQFACPPGWHCVQEKLNAGQQGHSNSAQQEESAAELARRPLEGNAEERDSLGQLPPVPPPLEPKPRPVLLLASLSAAPLSVSARDGLFGIGFGAALPVGREGRLELSLDGWSGTDLARQQRLEAVPAVSFAWASRSHHTWSAHMLVGLSLPVARVDTERYGTQTYVYLGGHLGPVMRVQVSRRVAVSVAALGLLRTRIDGRKARQPEFRDRLRAVTSNTSGSGLVRLGAEVAF